MSADQGYVDLRLNRQDGQINELTVMSDELSQSVQQIATNAANAADLALAVGTETASGKEQVEQTIGSIHSLLPRSRDVSVM